jgi:hypothetical protein
LVLFFFATETPLLIAKGIAIRAQASEEALNRSRFLEISGASLLFGQRKAHTVSMNWKPVLLALFRCEILGSYDCLGNIRVSAKGALAVIVLGLLFITLASGH